MKGLKDLFGKRPTTKSDVVLAAGAAVMAIWKAFDVFNEYKTEQAEKADLTKENDK